MPAAIAVRPGGVNVSAAEKFTQALSLSGADAPGMPPTLVLPVGWYKPARVIEAFLDQRARLRLNEVVERGIDFERVRFERWRSERTLSERNYVNKLWERIYGPLHSASKPSNSAIRPRGARGFRPGVPATL